MKKINYGMIGGGEGAFIGAVHRMAAALDGQFELVTGAFSADPARARSSGVALGLPADRCYANYADMISAEKNRPSAERMDVVVIVTPNHRHAAPARMALEAGFHVLSEKPATLNLAEARELAATVKRTGLLYGLTHNYTGYPKVKEAREIVRSGKLGRIRKVVVEYAQGWLSSRLEASGQKQAAWRTDPVQAGAGCVGDIGTHAENLAEYITGLRIKELAADLTSFVEGRAIDDDAAILLRFEGGAKGLMHCSQICIGEENNLSIRVYGDRGGLEWHQQEPNTLLVKWPDRPAAIYRTGGGYLTARASANTRTPGGHPEGFIEAFANIYRAFGQAVRARAEGRPADEADFPGIEDGVRGMAFIEAVQTSSRENAKWCQLKNI